MDDVDTAEVLNTFVLIGAIATVGYVWESVIDVCRVRSGYWDRDPKGLAAEPMILRLLTGLFVLAVSCGLIGVGSHWVGAAQDFRVFSGFFLGVALAVAVWRNRSRANRRI